MPFPPPQSTGQHKATITLGGYRHGYYVVMPRVSMGSPVVALHGFGTSGYRTFRHVAGAFQQRGIALYALDLLGFGRSDKPQRIYSLDLYARLVRAFVDALGLTAPVLLGHSLGAKVAAASVVADEDAFAGLILVNPGGFSRYSPLLPLFGDSAVVAWLVQQRWFYKGVVPHTPLRSVFRTDAPRQELLRLRGSHAHLDLQRTGVAQRLQALDLPSLVIWGRDDEILPASTATRALSHLRNGSLVYLDAAGHAPMKAQPEAFSDAVAAFIRRVDRR